MAETPAVCEHVHLPAQSGSNAVLRRMLRRYTREQYLEVMAAAPVGDPGDHLLDRPHRRVSGRDRGPVRGDGLAGAGGGFRRCLYLQILRQGRNAGGRLGDRSPDGSAATAWGGSSRRFGTDPAEERGAGGTGARSAGRAAGRRGDDAGPDPDEPDRAARAVPPQAVGEYHRVPAHRDDGVDLYGSVETPHWRCYDPNIVEDHVIEAYEALRRHFPDFCGCDICRADVIVYALNRLPPRYVPPEGSIVTRSTWTKEQGGRRSSRDDGGLQRVTSPRAAAAGSAAAREPGRWRRAARDSASGADLAPALVRSVPVWRPSLLPSAPARCWPPDPGRRCRTRAACRSWSSQSACRAGPGAGG